MPSHGRLRVHLHRLAPVARAAGGGRGQPLRAVARARRRPGRSPAARPWRPARRCRRARWPASGSRRRERRRARRRARGWRARGSRGAGRLDGGRGSRPRGRRRSARRAAAAAARRSPGRRRCAAPSARCRRSGRPARTPTRRAGRSPPARRRAATTARRRSGTIASHSATPIATASSAPREYGEHQRRRSAAPSAGPGERVERGVAGAPRAEPQQRRDAERRGEADAVPVVERRAQARERLVGRERGGEDLGQQRPAGRARRRRSRSPASSALQLPGRSRPSASPPASDGEVRERAVGLQPRVAGHQRPA